MALTDAQKRARDKWLSEKVEEIKFRVPKGQKVIIQEHAAKQGESVNSFLQEQVHYRQLILPRYSPESVPVPCIFFWYGKICGSSRKNTI